MNNDVYNIGIKNIRELEFSNIDLPIENINNFDKGKLKFELDFNFKWSIEEETFIVIATISYHYPIESKILTLTKLKLAIEFYVEYLSEILAESEQGFNINDTLLETFIGISLSTARGVLSVKTKGSYIHQYFLPIIIPKDILLQMRKEYNAPQKLDRAVRLKKYNFTV